MIIDVLFQISAYAVKACNGRGVKIGSRKRGHALCKGAVKIEEPSADLVNQIGKPG